MEVSFDYAGKVLFRHDLPCVPNKGDTITVSPVEKPYPPSDVKVYEVKYILYAFRENGSIIDVTCILNRTL